VAGKENTTNNYVQNKSWYNVNFNVAWSLIKLISLPSAIKAAHSQINIEKMTQAALSLAVIMQVNLAYNEYQMLQTDYQDSLNEMGTEKEIYNKTQILLKAYRSNEQALTRRKLNYYNSVIDNDVALSAIYTAIGKLKMAVGMTYLPHINIQTISQIPLSKLTHLVARELSVTIDKSFSAQVDFTYKKLMHQVAQLEKKKVGKKQLIHSTRATYNKQ
jgi:hypothetical protein